MSQDQIETPLLHEHGVKHSKINFNLSSEELYAEALSRGEGRLASNESLVVSTGKFTGRSPKDKFIVRHPDSEKHVWWGTVNRDISQENFEKLYSKMKAAMNEKELFVADLFAGADPTYRLNVRVINEYAWHNLFCQNLFIKPTAAELADHNVQFTVIDIPSVKADPATDGTNSETFIVVNIEKGLILIGGTEYAGEMKKSIFSTLNYLLPLRDVFPMHCSANIGPNGDTAIFFGLSGTGKTTLSADPNRRLIGDDEHGWSDKGVFNFEGGCYAKTIKLSKENEPEIWNAIRRGAVLENVVLNEQGVPDYNDTSKTENTRTAYPLEFIENSVLPSVGGHPKNIILLTADAFGVLPPISKLTKEQAMYHFISGYTAKLAGTERGVTEPEPNFSTCFGAPFMVHHPSVYAELLGKRIDEHGSKIWLVNTGWTGGPYGIGKRMNLPYTRAMVNAALNGMLDTVETELDPFFGLHVPKSVPGVPNEVLNPRNTWDDKSAYDRDAKELAGRFIENFKKYAAGTSEAICNAGPKG
ncbi:MAG TPA: phosphoenolpyruvate carboxykinase (ATP) [Candidatus Kapabacteria bacterium]|nr:phosphoenolpyruvate carboxykinase (ATP) [Candidatus Kapabacteria bacterium]